ncbi:hypothetical protein L211DRAFT_833783 [Terfezia boudieri ATCC MYA-4762]|uniref:Uncharacterized protein n=1 Tax=Terfezia boudieri ATCC MYA-4762 TaxID=1051890 RepID=A0A3N4LY29_9PEZI|nr:hypothetical protein L211DRAFT_833783 [Terfezia boudieri ATCC MYA-4762]
MDDPLTSPQQQTPAASGGPVTILMKNGQKSIAEYITSCSSPCSIFIISVGGALDPRRDMVNNGIDLEQRGWISRFRLAVFDRSPHPVYGQQIFVSEGTSPHRIWVSKDNSERDGWTPKLDFWAYSHDVGNCVMIAVGQATKPCCRCKFEIGRRIGNAPEDKDWKEIFVFWVKYGSFA